MHTLTDAFLNVFFLILLIGGGVAVKYFRLLREDAEKDLSSLLVNWFWPASIFYAVVTRLELNDLLQNYILPVSALITAVCGLVTGLAAVYIFRIKGSDRKIFLYHSVINNYVFIVIPFVDSMIPGKGRALLFVHNLGFIIIVWTLGISLLSPAGSRLNFKTVFTPGLVVTLLAIAGALLSVKNFIPAVFFKAVGAMGEPTIPVSMILAGAQIYTLGAKAMRFDFWNILLGIIRLLIIPGILLILAFFLQRFISIPRETMLIFLLVNAMPVSIISVPLAKKFNVAPERAAEGVVFTHVWSLATVTFYLCLYRLVIPGL
ncbi:MAG: hypothetical protein A2096_13925 [Spirochaetes bacterium GWF1_41_5]|nr:MAG: hypothetical protein A2096_13925 [Spirochaetes bacterium GWF1_41_5]HBE02460.1 hypothetical protein [Spirochaetia bacterium]